MSDPERPPAPRPVESADPVDQPRRRGPGIAVIVVILYGLLFLAALYFFKSAAARP
jgi:hypothetical protein